MDYEQILAAKAAGTATVTFDKGEIITPVPVAPVNERITVTTKRFDPYTGSEVAPVVVNYYKRDLLNEVTSLDQQIANLTARKEAICQLLLEFEPVQEERY